jgi:hypothetical protein
MISDIANTTCVDAILAHEEHQYVAIDRCAAAGAALDVTLGLEFFLKHRHATRLCHEENKAAERNIIARRLRHAGSGWGGNTRCRLRYRFRFPPQRKSLVKIDVDAPG